MGKSGKKSNPYSSGGLDKFARLNAELAAKREYVAMKTGAPEDLVRFAYCRKGWIPVVVKGHSGGNGAPKVSNLPPLGTKTPLKKEEEGIKDNGGRDMGQEKDDDGSESQRVVPWMSYFSELFPYRQCGTPETMRKRQPLPSPEHDNKIIEWEKKVKPVLFLSVPNSPMREQAQQPTVFSVVKRKDAKTQKQGTKKSNSKELGRIVSMDGQPRTPIRFQQSENFSRRRKRAEGRAIDATVMIIVFFCLIFFGKLCAICCTSAWWYLLHKLRNGGNSGRNSNENRKLGIQCREYSIKDGLLVRKHNHVSG